MLKIGDVRLESNLLLAPIAGYCDLAFRIVCRSMGGLGLACTDLLSPQGLLRGSATSLDLARTREDDRPICMQLYGSDPGVMAEGARWARDHGATVIDINMGCPVDKVTKKDGGSKLLCDAERAVRIVEAVAGAVGGGGGATPVTAKVRLGWLDPPAPGVAEWLAPRLVGAGAAAITVHGRTTEQRFSGVVSLEGIARVVAAVKAVDRRVAVMGNGDVKGAADVVRMIEVTGCDGVMIGRGALSAPWLFRDAWALQTTGVMPPEPAEGEKVGLVRRYFALMLELRGERYALNQIRRRISWFGKRLGPCKPLREAVRSAAGPGEVWAALDEFERGGLRFGGGAEGEEAERPGSLSDCYTGAAG